MIEVIILDSLKNLSDAALWALFDETQDLLEELPCGSWERGVAIANLRIIMMKLGQRHRANENSDPRI